MSPQMAYLHSLGVETLALRVERVCANTMAVASFLQSNKNVVSVNYPGLTDSPYYELAQKQFQNKFGGVITFELSDKQSCFRFINRLRVIRRASNLGDNTSLIIHPASTIYREFTEEEKVSMGVNEGLIRLSVGIETVEDIIGDLQQALKAV